MKIVLVSSTWTTHRRSARENTCEIRADQLGSLGHEVHVVTTCDPKIEMRQQDHHLLHLCDSEPGRWTRRFADECTMICEAVKPDIIHLEDFEPTLRWWESRPGGARRVSCTLHESLPGWVKTVHALHAKGKIERVPTALISESRIAAEREAVLSFDRVAVGCRQDMIHGEAYYPGAKLVLIYGPVGGRFYRPRSDKMPQRNCFAVASSPFTHRHGHRDIEKASEQSGVSAHLITDGWPSKMPGLLDSYTGQLSRAISRGV